MAQPAASRSATVVAAKPSMRVSFVVGDRCLRLTVKGRWLDATVGELLDRALAGVGGGGAAYTARGYARSASVRSALTDGAVVVVDALGEAAVVATALTGDFAPIFAIWLPRFLAATDAAVDLVVCCLDRGAEAAVAAARAPGRVVRALGAADGFVSPADRASVWDQRLAAVARVLEEEIAGRRRPVVHSDVDAFWLADPRPLLAAVAEPVAFSIDHGLGRGAKPFALCCGLYRVSPSPAGRAYLAALRRATRAAGDDQVAANALYDADPARVGLLPYESFQRCNARHATVDLPVVWHPWLDAPVAEKAAVWAEVVAELASGNRALLDAFYETGAPPPAGPRAGPARAPSVCLGGAALAALRGRGAPA